jgi:hypothetical protein
VRKVLKIAKRRSRWRYPSVTMRTRILATLSRTPRSVPHLILVQSVDSVRYEESVMAKSKTSKAICNPVTIRTKWG